MYSFTSTVRFSECDETSTLSLVSLINYLQDCSAFHTESLGVGIDFQRERGYAWAITSWRIEIAALPRLCDAIEVRTRCYDIKGTHAMRNYALYAADGTRLVAADAKYVVFDRATGKMMRIPESEQIYLEREPRIEMGPLEKKILIPGDYIETDPIVISKHHLDYNDHVNNAQYVEMARECLPEDFRIFRICAEYRKAAKLGDVIFPLAAKTGDGYVVSLKSEAGEAYANIMLTGH